jgi:hypothetical protein
MYRRHRQLKAKNHSLGFWGALETLTYEIKPILYMTFSLAILQSNMTSLMFIKFAAVYVLLFSLFISMCRLSNRGYI